MIVFSQKGQRPLFNQCSGSDLDGDIYMVSWCKDLIPKAIYKPYNYVNTNALVKDTVLLSDMVNFYIRHMRSYQLGVIANSFSAISDKHGIFSPKAMKLAELFNKNIDYVKTGHLTSVPEDLIPLEYPDFMERDPSYTSDKAIGFLYRRSNFDISNINLCECFSCTNHEGNSYKKIILKGSYVLIRSNDIKEDISVYSYKDDLEDLISKYSLKSEEFLFTSSADHIRNQITDIKV